MSLRFLLKAVLFCITRKGDKVEFIIHILVDYMIFQSCKLH